MKKAILIIALTLASLRLGAQESCAPIAAGSNQIAGGAFRDTFSVQQAIDIDLTVQLKKGVVQRLKSDAVLEVRIYNPAGYLYKSTSIPISADSTKKGQKRKIDGYPRPINVQVLNPVTRGNDAFFEAKIRLPVVGTSIVRNSMYGTWSAEALLNGEALKCGNRTTFTITR